MTDAITPQLTACWTCFFATIQRGMSYGKMTGCTDTTWTLGKHGN